MHTIDHYCYHSGLRGVNAGLKFAYAAATMLICLISRSLAAAALVLLANGILTVKKGRIPFPFYRKFLLHYCIRKRLVLRISDGEMRSGL